MTLVSASVPLSDIQFTLLFPAGRLTNWSITSTNIAVGAAILQSSSASQAQFDVRALSGRSLQGPASIAQICFQALGGHSGVAQMVITNMQGTESSGALAGASTGMSGTVTVVAVEPLLQAGPTRTNSTIVLTLYGNPGSNYVIQSSTTLNSNDWQTAISTTPGGVASQISVGTAGTNAPVRFFRAYQQTP